MTMCLPWASARTWNPVGRSEDLIFINASVLANLPGKRGFDPFIAKQTVTTLSRSIAAIPRKRRNAGGNLRAPPRAAAAAQPGPHYARKTYIHSTRQGG